MSSSSGESHRIYWQQWLSSSTANGSTANGQSTTAVVERKSRRELITSSAAVRISPTGARARDVTQLLRQTLNLPNLPSDAKSPDEQDSLVLVGTLYSLPRSYVEFEHEIPFQQLARQRSMANGSQGNSEASQTAYIAHSRSDPFHVVKTLRPDDNPLVIRDKVAEHLARLQRSAPAMRTIISPKMQWFYVPAASETSSLIPNFIDLDGYCTSLEDDDEDETDVDDERVSAISFNSADEELQARFPWLQKTRQAQLPADIDARHAIIKRRMEREDCRFQELCVSQSALPQHCVSGFLLKRSAVDPHVWRRVHCVLTDEYMWYVSRIYTQAGLRYAKHMRIRLTRALLLEPSADYTPLQRTPYAFELVSASGTSHIFRAPSKNLQLKWIHVLTDRIVQSFENSLVEHAELIVADECMARNRRLTAHAVEPLWKALSTSHVKSCPPLTYDAPIQAVWRWGLEVADYRESCRYVQTILPAKSPVVVTSPDRKYTPQSKRTNGVVVAPEPVDAAVQDMIRHTWRRASDLLLSASQTSSLMKQKRSHSVETLCRHVEYILTGSFRHEDAAQPRPNSSSNGPPSSGNNHQEPPPVDLFDALLVELQGLAVSTSDPAGTVAASNGT